MRLQKKKGGHTGDMYFLTQIDYAKLVKVFDDDLAWEIYELMVDSYFGFSEKTAPDKRIGIEHTRGTNAPNGLDIRYNLDLTKILTNPTPKSIMLLSRLTGINLEDIAEMPNDHQLMTEQALNQALAKTFLSEACTRDPDASINATDLYNAFATWSQTRHPDRIAPSQKVFGLVASSLGLKRQKGDGGLVYYLDISLKDADHVNH